MIDVMKIGKEEAFTLVEASEQTGLSPNTLRAQIKNGVLPATLGGKTYFVLRKDLDIYMRDHAGRPGRPKKTTKPSRGPRKPKGGAE